MIIEGIVGSNIYGDIAIDDLSFSNGACGLSPAKARPRSVTTTTVPPTTTRTVTATSSEKINFQNTYEFKQELGI